MAPGKQATVPEGTFWNFLERRAGKITGVVITGGEPTLQPDLDLFLAEIHKHHLEVKLDTNGYQPEILSRLLTEHLVDYVAMDVKAPPEKYALLAGVPNLDVERIAQSIRMVAESHLPYEFRTTIVPTLLDQADMETLAQWLADLCKEAPSPPHYVLQQFRGVKTLDPALEGVAPYSVDILHSIEKNIKQYLPEITLRGV